MSESVTSSEMKGKHKMLASVTVIFISLELYRALVDGVPCITVAALIRQLHSYQFKETLKQTQYTHLISDV